MKNSHTSSLSHEAKEQRRFKAGRMFKEGIHQAEVARRLRVTPASVNGWNHAWKDKGMQGLKSKGHTGFPSQMTERDRVKLKGAIIKGATKYGYETDMWTLERISAVMRKITKKSFGTTWTWHIVTQLGFTCQKPERKSKERDETAIRRWREVTFPRLKKMGAETSVFTGVSR